MSLEGRQLLNVRSETGSVCTAGRIRAKVGQAAGATVSRRDVDAVKEPRRRAGVRVVGSGGTLQLNSLVRIPVKKRAA